MLGSENGQLAAASGRMLLVRRNAMTQPTKTQVFDYDRMSTPIGEMLVVTDEQARLRAIDWDGYEPRMLRLLARHYRPDGFSLRMGRCPTAVREPLAAYFEGALHVLDELPVATGGTPFQRRVWAALRQIPAGRTLSYGELAALIEQPRAVRAVGLANGANPIGVVVPCHRVIGADRSLTGYAGGVERKRWLLEHENARFNSAARQVSLPC
jgi:methylated-DNA-[protein]-cysteine S-methyltransferase